ncbi:MAG: putative photosynthetic complex assembly protein PuhE [Myxococcota bacterium]
MSDRVMAAMVVVLAWWASTGVVLRLVWLPRRTHIASVIVMTALAGGGGVAVYETLGVTTAEAAYTAFGGALALWAWHELVFLLGWVTGPHRTPWAPGGTGWRRFVQATSVLIHHEVALAVTFLALAAPSVGAANRVAAWTFGVLWVMRLSAKFNVFLGVRNVSVEFVLPHLRYLTTYFRRAPMNALMPVSLLVGGGMVVALGAHALGWRAGSMVGQPGAGAAFGVTAHTLIATILVLALVEHLCLVLPLPDAMLWRWLLRDLRREARSDV